MRDRSNTFQILSRQEDRTQMVVFDERADLRADRGAIKAHHKKLAHLPGIATWMVSMISYMVTAASGVETSRRGNSLNRPVTRVGVPQGRGDASGWMDGWMVEHRGKSTYTSSGTRRPTYLSRSSQPGGSMSSFGAMALGDEECQQFPASLAVAGTVEERVEGDGESVTGWVGGW